MTTRRVPIRPTAEQQQQSEQGVGGGLQFDVLVRKEALSVREVAEPSSSAIYNICRAKANQVMMMKHRGYVIPPEELSWIDCSLNEETLIQKTRSMASMDIKKLIRTVLNREKDKAYTLERSSIPGQTAYNLYPYLEREGEEELRVGEFGFRNGRWELLRSEGDVVKTKVFKTEVLYVDNLSLGDNALNPFEEVASKILVYVGEEKDFKKELDKLVRYRRQGMEIFHLSELFIDYFQHWLVPRHEIVKDTDKIRLLNAHLMIPQPSGGFMKAPNCKITESGLPTIHHTDIVVRYLGGLPGHIMFWSNDSYISSFATKEFGYMLIVGHKYPTHRVEENLNPGERDPEAEEGEDTDEEVDEEEIEEEVDEEDFGGDDED
jgi:DNA-directed RNA polymerase subunit H (RpoH/RPB5)